MNKEIEEMMLTVPQKIVAYDGNPAGQHLYGEQRQQIAETLYNAGYRKTFTSDLASDTQKAFKEGYEKAKEELLENGELVSKEWHDEQVLHAESEIKRLQSENKTLRLAKDDFKKRLNDSGHRNKKLSLKLGSLKKDIRKAQAKGVKEFAEKLKEIIHKCDYVVGYAEIALCTEIDELLKEYEQ